METAASIVDIEVGMSPAALDALARVVHRHAGHERGDRVGREILAVPVTPEIECHENFPERVVKVAGKRGGQLGEHRRKAVRLVLAVPLDDLQIARFARLELLPVDGVTEGKGRKLAEVPEDFIAAVAVGVILHQLDEGALMRVEPVVSVGGHVSRS